MADLVLASRNRKKLLELEALLAPLGYRLRLVSEFSDVEPDESAPTFVENALIKARHAARVSGLPAIADDSGLEVAALGGAPGVHSARYSGVHGDDAANNAKLKRSAWLERLFQRHHRARSSSSTSRRFTHTTRQILRAVLNMASATH